MNVVFETADGLNAVENVPYETPADLPRRFNRAVCLDTIPVAGGRSYPNAGPAKTRKYDLLGKRATSELWVYRETVE